MITETDHILNTRPLLAPYDLVIFDLDDTLYPEKDYVHSGFHAISVAFGDPSLEEKFRNAFSEHKPALDTVLTAEHLADRIAEALLIYRTHQPAICLADGVRELLLAIRADGKRLGMITDGRPEGQRAKIRSLGIEPLFDEIIITDELGGPSFRKPNEAAFTLMHERTGIPYGKSVYIGDNQSKDFIAPQKLGMDGIWIRDPNGLYY